MNKRLQIAIAIIAGIAILIAGSYFLYIEIHVKRVIGIPKDYGKLICMEFSDSSKNYVPGEIIALTKEGTTDEQIIEAIKEMGEGAYLKRKGYVTVIGVPEGRENEYLAKLKSPIFKTKELNRCYILDKNI